VRSLRSRPAYLLIGVLLLGTGSAGLLLIGALLDGLLVRPPAAGLVFPHLPLTSGRLGLSTYTRARDQVPSFSAVAAYDGGAGVELAAGERKERTQVQGISPGYFSLLGAAPVRGRLLEESDDRAEAEPVAVLREDLLRRLQLEPGASVLINSHPFRVVGSVATRFAGLDRQAWPSVWIPLRATSLYQPSQVFTREGTVWLTLAARLAPAATPERALEELRRFDRRIELTTFTGLRFRYDVRARTLLLLGGALSALFLLALCNLFLLTLLRAFTRRRDVALRFALGARESDVAAWFWGELGVVVALGLAFGYSAARALLSQLGRVSETSVLVRAVSLDLRSVAPVVAVCVGAIWCLWRVARAQLQGNDLHTLLAEGAAVSSRHTLTRTLLAVQLALAALLLSLSLASWSALRAHREEASRFPTGRVLLLDADVRLLGWREPERAAAFYERVIAALRGVPGVLGCAAASLSPLVGTGSGTVHLPEDQQKEALWTLYGFVSPDYFTTLGSHFEQGRPFLAEEQRQKAEVAVINQAMAEALWPSSSPIGKSFVSWPGPRFSVVGVVDHTLSQALGSERKPQFYLPLTLDPQPRMTFLVQVERDSAQLRQALTRQLSSWWPLPEPPSWRSLDDQVEYSQRDLSAAVRVLFGVALFSAAVSALGLYFFSSFSAALALKEAALRLALGATWHALARRQIQLYAPTAVLGLSLGGLLVWGTRPVFHWLEVPTEAPSLQHLILALAPLAVITLLGLAAPIWRLRRLDVCRTLSLD